MAKSKNQILTELYESQFVQKYVRARVHDDPYYEDIVAEILLIMADMDEEALCHMYHYGRGLEAITALARGVIHRQLIQENSTVAKRYKKPLKVHAYVDTMPELPLAWSEYAEDDVLKRLSPLERDVMDKYKAVNYSLSALSAELGVDKWVCIMAIDAIKKKISK